MNSERYWDKKIIEWEDSVKKGTRVSFTEKLASFFREPNRFRANLAIDMLRPHVVNKTVLDLGCGSGFFDFDLQKETAPKHILGIDISPRAIGRATIVAKEKGLGGIVDFRVADAAAVSLPEADVAVGLGFLDYLTLEEIKNLFQQMRSEYFFFSFPERKFFLLRFIHIIYLLSQRCPRHFYYTKEEISRCIGNKYENVKFLNNKKLSFGCVVHNLPSQTM